MSDMYWPKAAPTPLHIDYIIQVRYTMHPVNHDYFEVKQTNLHDGVTDHMVYLPTYYEPHFARLLWRLSLIIALYNEFRTSRKKKYKAFRPALLRLMVFLDNVIEATIRPALSINIDDIPFWNNPNFDHYLAAEFLLGRHEPWSLCEFRLMVPTNIERISFMEFDWDLYDDRIDPEIAGHRYLYDIDTVPKTYWDNLWHKVEQHYVRPLDFEWISRWVDVDGEDMSEENEGSGEDDEEIRDGGCVEENEENEEREENKEEENKEKQERGEENNEEECNVVAREETRVDEENSEKDGDEDGQQRAGCTMGTTDVDIQPTPEARTSQSNVDCDDPTPPPPSPWLTGKKRRMREDDGEDTETPSRKRSAMAAAPLPHIVAFEPTL